jgi:uncharacterized membrane protein
LNDSATICDKQTYNFRWQILSQAGVYYDSLLTANGCDSVYELMLYVTPTYFIDDTVTICNTQQYNFHGRLLAQPGIYYDSLVGSTGCDSVYRLELQVTQGYLLTDSTTICANQTYNFRGQILSQSGVYYDSLLTTSGCDSVYQFTLHVTLTYLLTDSATICNTQQYNFHGRLLTQPGIYYDSLISSIGCDSVYQLELQVIQGYLLSDSATICANQTYNFRGQILSQAGIYYDSLLTASGCDSVYQFTLHVNPIDTMFLFGSVCQGEMFVDSTELFVIPEDSNLVT